MDQGWQEKHGTPPPWTSVGKRYYAAQKEREDLIANPPPVHGDARFLDLEGIKAIEREALALNETKTVPGNAFMLLGNGFDPVAQEFGGSVSLCRPGIS